MRLILFLSYFLSLIAAHSLGKYGGRSQNVQFSPTCASCKALVATMGLVVKWDKTEPVILEFATLICKLFAKQSWVVCDGISGQFRDEFFYVFRRLSASPTQICGILLPDCADPTDPSESAWNVYIPKPPPRKIKKKKTMMASNRNFRVLQLSDLHVDLEYKEDTEADCSLPVCCRKREGVVKKLSGYWGTAGQCDIPYRTIENMLQHINSTQIVDYILLSGDYINHIDWEYTKEEHLRVLKNLHDLIKKFFPSTPTFWALGNHEGVPVNSFAPHSVEERFWPTWLYEQLHEMSQPWLGKDNSESILYRGSYVTKLMDGLKLINVNTGFCETTNFFLYLNQSDPDGTMSWLVEQLYKAEQDGDKVQILAHIPPGDGECLEGWSRNYYRVIQRFSSTIVGQFFGHDHLDYFTVFYEDMNNVYSKPISVGYAAPSVTTYANMNPAYRIYQVDSNNGFKIVDYETYSADLSVSNKTTPPTWKLQYSAKSAYQMKDLSPNSWNEVVYNIFNQPETKDKFVRNSFRMSSTPVCDEICISNLLCQLRSGHHNSSLYCAPPIKLNRY